MSAEGIELAGWEVEHTGGNCTALRRPASELLTEGRYWLLTDDASVPTDTMQGCTLGLYDDGEDRDVSVCWEFPNVPTALAFVALTEGGIDLQGIWITRAISVIEEGDRDAGDRSRGARAADQGIAGADRRRPWLRRDRSTS